MAWFFSLAGGVFILLFISSRLYLGCSNLERSIGARSDAGIRVPPNDLDTLKLRKSGLRISLLVSVALIVTGLFIYFSDSAKHRSRGGQTAEPDLTLIQVPSDSGANYWLVSKERAGKLYEIVTRRNGPSGASYAKRAYDCSSGTVMYLGEGLTLEEMSRSRPSSGMSEIVPGSIAHYVGLEACREQ